MNVNIGLNLLCSSFANITPRMSTNPMQILHLLAQIPYLKLRSPSRRDRFACFSRLPALAGALAVLGLVAFAGANADAASASPTPAPTPGLVYVANNGGGNISGYTADPNTGILNATAAIFSGHAPSQAVVVSVSSNNYVYATNSADGTVSGFSLNLANGSLTPLPGTDANPFPVPAGSNPNGIVQAASGKFLYVANTASNSISEFAITSGDGTLTPTVQGSVAT